MRADEHLIPASAAMDHLLLGAADLDRGIAWVERMTGLKAALGGSHPGAGTRNALLSLGGKRYLEIIAPDPMQPSYNFHIDLRTLGEPRLVAWAAVATDVNAVATKAHEAGYQLVGPRDGSRARPDGKMLKWKTIGVLDKLGLQGIEPIPFFIEWAGDSLHPSQDSPKGCELDSFEIAHPQPEDVIEVLRKLGIEARVKRAKGGSLEATLRTPRGKVRLN